MPRETVGKLSSDLLLKTPDTRDPIEIQREVHKSYIDELKTCVEDGRKKYFGDFYVVVMTKNERLLPNVLRNFFHHRKSCPTPQWDQSVFRFDAAAEAIHYLWTVPSRDACHYLRDNAALVAPEERQLLQHVLHFFDGTLLKKAKILNNEQEDSLLIDPRSSCAPQQIKDGICLT